MSFRQKVLLGVLLLFVAAFDAGAFLMAKRDAALNLERERARALSNHYALAQSALAQWARLPKTIEEGAALRIVRDELALSGAAREATLYWIRDGEPLSAQGALPESLLRALLVRDGRRRTAVWTIGGESALLASGWLSQPLNDYALVTATSLAPLARANALLARAVAWIALGASAIALSSAWLMLRRLLAPLEDLAAAMRGVRRGDYARRVAVRGADEMAALAAGFNAMSDKLERHVAALQNMAEEKQRYADNLAHEIRTPTTAIGGYARSLLQLPMGAEDQRKALKYIASESARIQRMSEALVELSALRKGAPRLERVRVDQLFERALRTVRPDLQAKGVKARAEVGARLLICDAALIESALVNLLVNAARASKPGGEIVLASEAARKQTRLWVADSGRGMTPEQAARATEPFYRTDEGRSRRDGGAGLGLALCRQIADCHGARLEILSAPGKGTRVSLVFTTPLQADEDLETDPALGWGGQSDGRDFREQATGHLDALPGGADPGRQRGRAAQAVELGASAAGGGGRGARDRRKRRARRPARDSGGLSKTV